MSPERQDAAGAAVAVNRVWRVGDDVDTDQLAPGQYMKFDVATIASHCLEQALPSFAREVRAGDVLIAGRNFGCGSSREQAAAVLRHLGIRAVIAESFAGLFYRNAFNLGLLLLQSEQAARLDQARDLRIDARAGKVEFVRAGVSGDSVSDDSASDESVSDDNARRDTILCEPVPDFLLDYVDAGGLMGYLKARRASR